MASAANRVSPPGQPADGAGRLSPAEFRALFESFTASAFRLETLPEYRVEGEADEFALYLQGEPLPPDGNEAWCRGARAGPAYPGGCSARWHVWHVSTCPSRRLIDGSGPGREAGGRLQRRVPAPLRPAGTVEPPSTTRPVDSQSERAGDRLLRRGRLPSRPRGREGGPGQSGAGGREVPVVDGPIRRGQPGTRGVERRLCGSEEADRARRIVAG